MEGRGGYNFREKGILYARVGLCSLGGGVGGGGVGGGGMGVMSSDGGGEVDVYMWAKLRGLE